MGSRKKTIEEVRQIFSDGGCELISAEYINYQTPLKYRCVCGRIATIRIGDFKRGRRCNECKAERLRSMFKYTYGEVSEYFRSCGCSLLSEDYVNNHQKLPFICSCGEKGTTTFKRFKQGVRCESCNKKKVSGENHHSWNHDKTDEERKMGRYADGPIRQWSRLVKERDSYTCRVCKSSRQDVVAHHIESYQDRKEIRFDVKNGATLCNPCHKKFHSKYGYKHNDREQFKEFLTLEKGVVTIPNQIRVLSFDTSMGRPGVCLLEVRKGRATILDLSYVSTNAKQHHGLRAEIVEAWAISFIAKHYTKGFDVIVREDYVAKTSKTGHPVYSAWGSCDRALNKFGLNFTTPAISQSAVKKAVFGKGKAEKEELAQAVREWTGYTGEFVVDDESDAAAIGLAYLINEGVIKKTEG